MADEPPPLDPPPVPEGLPPPQLPPEIPLEEEEDRRLWPTYDDRARFKLALLVLVQFFLLVGYLLWSDRSFADDQMVLTAEITFVTATISYYFGSSSGSKSKDRMLDKAPTTT